MIDGRMNINSFTTTTLTALSTLLLALSPHILLVIRQRHIEIKRLVPLCKT